MDRTFRADARPIRRVLYGSKLLVLPALLIAVHIAIGWPGWFATSVGAIVGCMVAALGFVGRSAWGDQIEFRSERELLIISKAGKKRLHILPKTIITVRTKVDSVTIAWLNANRRDSLVIGRENFEDKSWKKLCEALSSLSFDGSDGLTRLQSSSTKAAHLWATLSIVCVFFSIALLVHYFILSSSEAQGSQQSYGWTTVVRLSEVIGNLGLLMLGILLAAGALLFALKARYALRRIKEEIGADAFDALALQEARDRAQREGLIGGSMPAHLQSVAALRSYRKRIKFLLLALVGTFSVVGIGVAFGFLQ